ncbi:MAG: insulinase family protein [Deltaproteobacteria bacterium]|nr:insulinase family protein [Deltaproteobacteria bacterium]
MRFLILILILISCSGIIKNRHIKTSEVVSEKSTHRNEGEIIDMQNQSTSSFIKDFTLKNGLKLIVEEDHSAPVVAIQAWVSLGSADESDETAGIAHFHEHMLFKGTQRRGLGEIAKIIEENGGDINAWTSFDDTVYHITIPSSKYDLGLEIISDVLMNSTFDPREIAKEKEVILEEIRQNRDIPQRRLIDELFSLSFDVHPYKRPVIGYAETIRKLNRQKVLEFYKKFYVPQNIVLVVVGDVSAVEVYAHVERLFSKFSGVKPAVERRAEPRQNYTKIKIIKDKFVETLIGVAFHITSIEEEDTPVLDLLSVLLGGSQSSKLKERIIVDKTLATDVFAYSYTPKDKGLFIVGAELPFVNVHDAFQEIFDTLIRYKYERFSSAEVNKAIVQVESDDVFSLTTMQGRARKLGFYQTMTGDYEFGKKYLNRLKNVTPEEILQVAKKYFTKDNMSVVVLLPDSVNEPVISNEDIINLFNKSEDFYKRRADDVDSDKQVVKKVLKNGLTLIMERNSRLPIVSIRATSLGGVRYENEANAGISNFVARMLTRGNTSMNIFQIMRTIDNIGGSISGYSGKNSLGLRAEFLSKYQELGLKIFLDCLFKSEFAADQVEKERRLILEEIKNREDDLPYQSLQLFLTTLYQRHPYKYPILGNENSISKVTREELVDFYRRVIVPRNVVIAIVGDIEPHTLEQMIDEYMQNIQDTEFTPKKLDPEQKPSGVRTQIIYKEKEQAHIVVGFLGSTLYEKDRYVLEILSVILGGQSGRLFVNLRDKKSLAYTISTFNVEGIENGYFAIYLSCAHHKVKISQEAIFDELKRLSIEGISESELEKAKNYLIGIHSIEMQEYSVRAYLYSLDELYGLGYDFHNKYTEIIKSITLNDIREAISKYFELENAVISIIKSQIK